ncbi:MAG: trypsin-like peptidase domain-containing protein [Eggerthellaceae bacterium]|nr:trypsin-like peptidase domain-containing protein [Eggerthellaceae bacterium]
MGSTQTMPQAEAPRASYRETTTHVGDGDPAPTNPYSGQRNSYAQAPAAHAAAPAQKTGGAGKTFLFGFLGALLACALAFGGFAAWNNANAATTSASAVTGTSDSTVINAVEEGQTLAEAVAAKALPSVVAVYNYQQSSSGYGFGYGYNTNSANDLSASGMGSGVVISQDGYIITNYHVVENASKITVKVGDDEREAKYVGGDSSSDVAVVKVDNTEGLTAADIGDSDSLRIGEWVMTVGAPLGLEQSVATGVVSATNRSTIMSDSDSTSYYYGTSNNYTYYPNMIQTDAVINPGNSGGALVDADGKLIGINTMISSYSGDYAGVGFAIPVNYAMGIAQQIIDGKTPTHALLGVSISSVNSNNAQRYGLTATSGAYISSIAEGTGAANSDLKVGDIITQVDDTKITSTTDVTLEVREHNPGDTVTVTVNRNGQTLEIPVTLSSDENAGSSSDSGSQQQNQNQNGNGSGSGGSNRGYNSEQLEELLKMLGM